MAEVNRRRQDNTINIARLMANSAHTEWDD